MKRPGDSIIRCTSRGRLVAARTASITTGPMVRLGTKCPSITSTWIQSAPAFSTARISSASRPKSAERIDGAIRCLGVVTGVAPAWRRRSRRYRGGEGSSAGSHPCRPERASAREPRHPAAGENPASRRGTTRSPSRFPRVAGCRYCKRVRPPVSRRWPRFGGSSSSTRAVSTSGSTGRAWRIWSSDGGSPRNRRST